MFETWAKCAELFLYTAKHLNFWKKVFFFADIFKESKEYSFLCVRNLFSHIPLCVRNLPLTEDITEEIVDLVQLKVEILLGNSPSNAKGKLWVGGRSRIYFSSFLISNLINQCPKSLHKNYLKNLDKLLVGFPVCTELNSAQNSAQFLPFSECGGILEFKSVKCTIVISGRDV